MNEPRDIERAAIEHDRDLAWALFEAQPKHPRIPQLTQSVLARVPEFTGMIILLARHRKACGEKDEARQLLQELIGQRDRQYLNALRDLRDLEYSEGRYVECLRLAQLVLQEDPESDWEDFIDLGAAMVFPIDPETGWALIDDAVEMCARTDPDNYATALGLRAAHFLAFGVPPDRFLVAAEQAIEADPTQSVIATALAYAYLYSYRLEDASEILSRVLREDPTDEFAQAAMSVAKAMLAPLESGAGTMDDLRSAGAGEIAWRILRDKSFGTSVDEALLALEAVMPDDLAQSLRPPLSREEARESRGEDKVIAWHDGQVPGTGELWGQGWPFRLMTAAEIGEMDEAIEQHPQDWPQWKNESEYYQQIFTDDAGAYLIEGPGGRLYRRGTREADQEIAASLSDWLWDRVAAFGGHDPRPGRAGRMR
ncbi:hypothetical protein GCM10022198_04240 [Klugiella xanthotipulae]|uniref:Tetratricopeptide repeat protein n=1 Tax=Klugiella xanthotipulae TaxID=244735 RepID=A0A543HSK2_9MICO|nr:hypothetical protein [Klugiella xanthotipulae]TQM61317.1 hypothetical protein FB466_2266 [Klugiella xanthotipulae]